MGFLTKEQAQAMLELARGTDAYLGLLIAFSTGMRRGEIMGLRWKNVDLKEGIIHVVEQLQASGLKPLKTRASRRDIPMPRDLWEALKHHRTQQRVISLDGFVLAKADGSVRELGWLDRAFARYRDKLGLDRNLTLHSARKSFATWLAQAGVDPKTVAALLGHADIRTTLQIYQGVTPEMVRNASRVLDGLASNI